MAPVQRTRAIGISAERGCSSKRAGTGGQRRLDPARDGWAAGSALVGRCDAGSPLEPTTLVLDVNRHLAQGLLVLAPVVGAEQELTAGPEPDAHVRLGAAAVAAVLGGQRTGGRKRCCYVASLRSVLNCLSSGVPVPGTTVNQQCFVPAGRAEWFAESVLRARFLPEAPLPGHLTVHSSSSVRAAPS